MSTWIYLRCEDHDPPIRADGESGQHLFDLSSLRADVANREALVAEWDHGEGLHGKHWFQRNTAAFLAAHPKCRVGIVDEYGTEYPL